MNIEAKICGLNDEAAIAAAVAGGASYGGLVFYPPSPRAVSPERAAALAERADGICLVGLFVDPEDALVEAVLERVPLSWLQLHGRETPARVAELRHRFGRPVMKAVKIAGEQDLAVAEAYREVADMLLFDAKPPADMAGALPGGNGLAFDWAVLAGRQWDKPWMLSGGLSAGNIAEAVRISGAVRVDVSSGVEAAPGRKDPRAVKAFLDAVRRL